MVAVMSEIPCCNGALGASCYARAPLIPVRWSSIWADEAEAKAGRWWGWWGPRPRT